MQRMQQEGDFDLIEPVFFSTSNAGGNAPSFAKNETKLKDARASAEGSDEGAEEHARALRDVRRYEAFLSVEA